MGEVPVLHSLFVGGANKQAIWGRSYQDMGVIFLGRGIFLKQKPFNTFKNSVYIKEYNKLSEISVGKLRHINILLIIIWLFTVESQKINQMTNKLKMKSYW